MKKFLLPLLFLFLFLVESLFVQYLPEDAFGHNRILVPHFLFAAILFLTIFVGKKQGIIYAAIFGLLFDIVYVEIIGIYLFIYPFISYVISKIMQILQTNMIIAFLASVFGMALLEVGVYEMNHLIHVTNLDFMSFVNLRLYPTLILNAAFIVIAGYPLKRLFEKHAEALRVE
ncbi:rod shape-determining protein MreD [Neobacillus vireti]|uniref:Rod shape-determining protein MreD n=1 Tax=Neobacillus vireti LMG 21834 TaxID=1131730 RepID=A0AB94IRG8_9BACI|nr:rod shape-determining protein MreD [Neobacillus vireti]ETI69675.1 rod shape-determining protein MreD [Neobacillus vireti LMG 21834]KLT16844.1 rod shape-determining protein MreD [Neobacillus vireti]